MRRAVGHTSKLRRQRQRERQKSNRLNEQNNNSARTSRFCTFPCGPCTTTMRREMTKSVIRNVKFTDFVKLATSSKMQLAKCSLHTNFKVHSLL